MNRREFHMAALAAAASTGGTLAYADPPSEDLSNSRRWNIRMPTLGGKQLWADQWFFHAWRIQRNAVTGHYRLLDEQDYRHAWGTFAQCRAKFDQIRRARNLRPMRGRGVVVLHGLIRTRSAMKKMAALLRDRGKFNVFNVSYPSTRLNIGEHAQSLARVIESLRGITEINFVCHSLGNLVVRHWLGDLKRGRTPNRRFVVSTQSASRSEVEKTVRLGRMVMLGPPNHRPELAKTVSKVELVAQFGGKTLVQLSEEWDKLEPHLATPEFDFGILAGGKGDDSGYNPIIPGDDDLVVSVKSTKLSGARDFRILPVKHTFMKDDKKVQELTLRFLQKGWFESDTKRRPIEA